MPCPKLKPESKRVRESMLPPCFCGGFRAEKQGICRLTELVEV